MQETNTLKRGLSTRHIRFMALGSAIGTGLFYGSADAIRMAGPSVLLAYIIGGAVQGYRGLMAMIPGRDFGMVVLWNSESSLPSGMLPTILDRAIGLPPQRWLDVDPNLETLHAQRSHAPAAPSSSSGGSTSQRAAATPE